MNRQLSIVKMLVAAAGLALSSGAFANPCPEARPGDRVAMPTAAAAVARGKVVLAQVYKADTVAAYEPYVAELKGGVWEVSGRPPSGNRPLTVAISICRSTGIALSPERR